MTTNAKDEKVVALLKELAPALNAERVAAYLDSDEGFSALRSRFDRYATKAIQTHDEKREVEIQRRIDEAVTEASKTAKLTGAEQVRAELDALKAQIAERDAAIARRDLVSVIRTEAGKRSLPVDLIIDFDNPNLTEAKAIERMEAYEKTHAAEIQAGVTERLGASYKPGTGIAAKTQEPGMPEGVSNEVLEAMKAFEHVDL